MRQRTQVKPTMRYRIAYWFFSFFTVLFIMFRQHGETVVEHPLFIISSILLFLYAPFWLSNAVQYYEEHVQEEEISAIDKQALKALERMSLGYRREKGASRENSRRNSSSHRQQRLLQNHSENNNEDDIEMMGFDSEADPTARHQMHGDYNN